MMTEASHVIFEHKTGRYIGEPLENDGRRVLVKILAVVGHPEQGDLHNPGDPDAPMFHERRALSYTEKVWIPAQAARPYAGTVPDYRQSLKAALEAEVEKLERSKRWTERSLTLLETLRSDYKF
ncbi:sporulation phosphorelay system protein KapB [Cohnella faecalis]|uniref:Kinase n=1 Tax=Cohnella faecalis TaxID=2315694 RepID=A0A398CR81_9BACL|nr:sporulation phosphorelay system protein KapB [Cohnella faecalis]RIE03769.1 kinase [Cohnella faecalis]